MRGKRPANNEEHALKLRSESHMDELALVSAVKHNGKVFPEPKDHPFARDGFTYHRVYRKDGDDFQERTLSVGRNQEENTLYNLNEIKLVAPTRSAKPNPQMQKALQRRHPFHVNGHNGPAGQQPGQKLPIKA